MFVMKQLRQSLSGLLLGLMLAGQFAGQLHRLDLDAHDGTTVCHQCIAYASTDDLDCDAAAAPVPEAKSLAAAAIEPDRHVPAPVIPQSARGPPHTLLS
jgi:hypothetical protein